jgi:hypothetical protein
MLVRLPTALLLCAFAVAGCQCNLRDDLVGVPDTGEDINDAGPPPPKFPLKVDDQIQFPAIGGRTATCAGGQTEGDCQRAITATYIIKKVELGDDNRWTITADAVYQTSADVITASSITPLVLARGAPFDQLAGVGSSTSAEDAVFNTNAPAIPDASFTANSFPFFQYDPTDGTVFNEAADRFCDRYVELDPDANCETQLADQKFEVYFKDEQSGGAATLHKVREEFHQMGFVCGWDELTIPFQDTMARQQSDFDSAGTPDLAAIFASPVKIIRDGVTYNCSCFNQTCQEQGTSNCLSPDPDEGVVACP